MTLQEFLTKLATDSNLMNDISKLSGSLLYDKLTELNLDREDTQALVEALNQPDGESKIKERLIEQTGFRIVGANHTNVYQVMGKTYIDPPQILTTEPPWKFGFHTETDEPIHAENMETHEIRKGAIDGSMDAPASPSIE